MSLCAGSIGHRRNKIMANRTCLLHVACALLSLRAASSLCITEEQAAPQPKLSNEEAQKIAVARLKSIAFAFHAYHEFNNELPPAALVRNDGKSLLSWRVLLLPHLGQ